MLKAIFSNINFLSRVNPLVRVFILSEGFFWSAWNFIIPIFAVFVVEKVPDGNIRIAALGLTVYLFVRVITELFVSNFISFSSNRMRVYTDIMGMILLSACYMLVAIVPTIITIYIFFIMAGISFGISSPAKFSLFSINIDKNREAASWGAYHAVTLTGMGIAAAIGGTIAYEFGFRILFFLSGIVNLLGIIPYMMYDKIHKEHKHFNSIPTTTFEQVNK